MTVTNPPKPRMLEIPWKVMVVRADPEFEIKRRREVFYEFTGRKFYGNNDTAGPYAPRHED